MVNNNQPCEKVILKRRGFQVESVIARTLITVGKARFSMFGKDWSLGGLTGISGRNSDITRSAQRDFERSVNQQVKGVTSMPTNQIEIYQSDTQRIEVRLDTQAETLWLSQRQMSELFDRDVRTINEHLQNIYEEEELDKTATIRKFRIVQKEGSRDVKREVDHYNLGCSALYRLSSELKDGSAVPYLGHPATEGTPAAGIHP